MAALYRRAGRHPFSSDLDNGLKAGPKFEDKARGGNQGGSMNRDELNGKADQLKGKVKQAAGDLTDDEQLHDEGVADEASGDVQETFGKARRKVGEAIKDVGDQIKK
jgi:uncharacterized protein YjbJ (UPF0337 family)